jgi:His-Xaa-Ser system radical SAM maturase HxsB
MDYFLLPFRFERFENSEVLVNEVGDYIVCPIGTAEKIVGRHISETDGIYKDLISNYFISTTRIPRLIDNLATRYRTKKSFLDNFTSLHIFVMTIRCNQNCLYCQASSKENNQTTYDISYETLDYGIDLMFQSPSPYLTMEFQGGEPTLLYDKLKYAIEKSETINNLKNKHITYVICTNSVALTDDLLALCHNYNILISTSLDGPEFVHNKNRGKNDSYQKVITGIDRARSEIGKDRISALMTTSELSLDYPKEIVDSYIENGFSNIFLRALNPYGLVYKTNDWQNYYSRFVDFYKEALEYIIEKNKEGVYFEESFTVLILKKILTPFPIGFVDLQSPAGLINSVVVYNYDGFVYASDESRMLAEHNDFTFRLGSVKDKYTDLFYGRKVLEIANTWSNEVLAGCSDCAFQAYCGADPVRNYTTQNDMEGFRPTSAFCKKNKAIIQHIFSLIINRHDEVMPIFKNWIKQN